MNNDNIIFIGLETRKNCCEHAYCLDDHLIKALEYKQNISFLVQILHLITGI